MRRRDRLKTPKSPRHRRKTKRASDHSGHELDAYCVNLNKKAREGKIDPLIGREAEINRTIQVLCRRQKNNPLFVGPDLDLDQEAKNVIEQWEENVEMEDPPRHPRTPLQQLLREYHEICEDILDIEDEDRPGTE